VIGHKSVKGKGSIFQCKDGRWVAEITNEAYKGKKTFYGKTRKEVQEKLHVALKNQLSAGTVQVTHAILFAALKDAVKWKRLAVNVCTAVTLPRLAQSERQPLTKDHASTIRMDILKQHRTYQLETRLKAGAAWQEHGLVFPIDTVQLLEEAVERGWFSRYAFS
jgi:hypothetical protein